MNDTNISVNIRKNSFSQQGQSMLTSRENSYLEKTSTTMLTYEKSTMSNLEFVSSINPYENFLRKVEPDKLINPFIMEMSGTLHKFPKMFEGQQKTLTNIKEIDLSRNIILREIGDLESCIQERNEIIKNLKVKNTEEENLMEITMKLEKKLETDSQIKDKTDDKKIVTLSHQQMMKRHKEIIIEKAECESKIMQLTKELEQKISRLYNLEERLTKDHNITKSINKELNETKILYQDEIRKRCKISQELMNTEFIVGIKQCEIDKLEKELHFANTKYQDKSVKLKETEERNSELTKQLNNLNKLFEKGKDLLKVTENKLALITIERDKFRFDSEKYKGKLKEIQSNIFTRNAKCEKCENNVFSLEDIKDNSNKKINLLQLEVIDLKQDIDMNERKLREQKNLNNIMEVELRSFKENNEQAKVQIENLMSETQAKGNNIKVLSQEIKTLQSQFNNENKINENITVNKIKTVKKTDQMTNKTISLNDNIIHRKQNAANLENQIESYEQKLISEHNSHMQTKEKLVSHQRSLDGVKVEYLNLRNTLSMSNQYVIQLEKQLRNCRNELSEAKQNNFNLNNNLSSLNIIFRKCKTALENNGNGNIERDIQVQTLNEALSDAEKITNIITRDRESITMQNKVLNIILTNKMQEIGLLKEKENVLCNALIRGKTDYNCKMEDIKFLQSTLMGLTLQKKLCERKVYNFPLLKTELALQELTNKKGIEEDCTKHSHRWRNLEGEDPEKYQLIIQNQSLQKQCTKSAMQLAQKQAKLKKIKKQNEKLTNELEIKQSSTQCDGNLIIYETKHDQAKIECDSLYAQVNILTPQLTKLKQENLKLKEELYQLKTNIYLKNLNGRFGI